MNFLLAFFTLLFSAAAPPQTITVSLQSSGAPGGNIYLAVYADARAFETDAHLLSVVRPYRQAEINLRLTLPAPGKYVLAAYHDLNGNGKLDTNLFGAPSEPYGFSTAPPSKWRAPRFDELVTDFGSVTTATIELKKWKEY